MAKSKLLVLWIAFSILLVGIRADSEVEEVIVEPVDSDSPLKLEIEQLRSKISSLESTLSGKTKELNNKDEGISALEKAIHEKSAAIATLQSDIESLQKKGDVVAEEQVGKAHARAGELEKEVGSKMTLVSHLEAQVGKLKAEKETLTRKSEALDARATDAEKKMEELILQLGNLEKTNEEQRRRLQKTERALKVAEEELMRAQLDATSKSKVLNEIHGAWLPPWLATHIGCFQDLAASHWNEHGKPVMDIFLAKVSEKSANAQKWAVPYLESAKTKWIPVVKEKWVKATTYLGPHVEKVSTKSVEVYKVCRRTITPHFVKVQELTAPYVLEARRLSKPYIDQVAIVTRPHVKKVRVVLKPYTNHAVYAYGKFLESATTYHHKVQGAVHEKLKKHELTKTLATKELVWFMASAVLALPVFFLYKIFSVMFCKKARTPSDTHASHGHRRHKRRHADQ